MKGPNRNERGRGLTHQTHEIVWTSRSRSIPRHPVWFRPSVQSRGTRRAQNLRRRQAASRSAQPSRGSLETTMSRPQKVVPASLEEAVAELKRDPSHPVQARVEGLDVELRVLPSNETQPGVGSRLAAIGPWEGIALDELDRILREGRDAGGSAPAPEMP